MTAQIGDDVMIMSEGSDQPVRQGEIRDSVTIPAASYYIVQWSDTSHQSLVPHGPDIVIKHRHGHGRDAVATGAPLEPSRLRHPLEWRHRQEREKASTRSRRAARLACTGHLHRGRAGSN